MRALAGLCGVAVLAVTGIARADRCGPDATAWVARCAAASSVAMRLESCPSAVAVVELRPEGKPLRVELSTSASSFRRIGPYGLAPIGDFPDWQLEPAATRNAFDAFAACVARENPEALLATDAAPPLRSNDGVRPNARPPFLLIAALLAAVFSCWRRWRLRPFAVALFATVTIAAFRHWLQPTTFFHQNGQGPEWVRYALQGDAGAYGAGYPELFGWIVARARRPDLAIFYAQQLLGATIPISGYAIVRAVGGRPTVSIIAAAALALDPLLVRTAQSESYYVAMTAFLFAGTSLVIVADAASRQRRILLTIVGALALAQAARVHPIAWMPCALAPLVVACRRGRLTRRVRRTVIAAAVVGAVVLALTLPGIRAVLRDNLGHSAGFARSRARDLAPLLAVVLALPVLATLARPTRVLGARALIVAIVVSVAIATNLLASNIAAVNAAYLHLFLPVAIAATAPLLNARVAVLATTVVLGIHIFHERRATALTTDAYEQQWCLAWRETLPRGAEVASLVRAGERILFLPFHGDGLPAVVPIGDGGSSPFTTGRRYYYRSSLCAVPEGAPICARFEAAHRLRLVASRRFPASESAPWMRFPNAEVDVAVFVVE